MFEEVVERPLGRPNSTAVHQNPVCHHVWGIKGVWSPMKLGENYESCSCCVCQGQARQMKAEKLIEGKNVTIFSQHLQKTMQKASNDLQHESFPTLRWCAAILEREYPHGHRTAISWYF